MELLTAAQIRERFGLTASALSHAIQAQRLPTAGWAGRGHLFRLADVRRYVESRRRRR